MQHADDVCRRSSCVSSSIRVSWRNVGRRTTWEDQLLLDDDLTSKGNGEKDTKEGDSEAPRQELSAGENDRRRPIEFRRELGESGDDSYETGSEG